MAALIHHHLEDLTAPSTTSATYVTLATIAKEDLVANNDYLIVARLAQAHDQSNDVGRVRISTLDDASIAAKSEQPLEGVESTLLNRGQLYFFVHSFSTDAVPADVLLEAHSRQAGETTQADQITFFLLDLTDLGSANYFETIHADDATEYELSMTDIFTIAGSNLGTDEWAILGYLRTECNSVGGDFGVQVLAANDTSTSAVRTFQQVEPEDANEDIITGFALRHKASSGTPNLQVQAFEEAAGNNHRNGGGYAIALKTAALADFVFDYEAGATTLDTTERTLATITSYSPSVTADHLIFGMWNQVLTTATRFTQIHVEDDDVEMRVGDQPLIQKVNSDVTNRPQSMIFHMDNILSSDTSTYTLRGQADNTDETVEHRWLMILSLEKGGVAAQTLDGVLFSRPPAFIVGIVTPGGVTVTGVLFTRPPSFITGAVTTTNVIDGVLFARPPSFIAGAITTTNLITGVLFTRPPTFIIGVVTPGGVQLDGVLFTRPPTFLVGSVSQRLSGVLFARPPSFVAGTITTTNLISGVLFVRSPTFLVGVISLPEGGAMLSMFGSLL